MYHYRLHSNSYRTIKYYGKSDDHSFFLNLSYYKNEIADNKNLVYNG